MSFNFPKVYKLLDLVRYYEIKMNYGDDQKWYRKFGQLFRISYPHLNLIKTCRNSTNVRSLNL